jgi:secreted trypsin-like serine protease
MKAKTEQNIRSRDFSVDVMGSKCLVLLVLAIVIGATKVRSNEVIKFDRSECENLSRAVGTIINGKISDRRKWPWMAALYTKSDQKLFCGGTLISQRVLLTAAHCLQDKKQKIPLEPKGVIVYLGRWNLTDPTEASVKATPEAFFIHPDWNPFDTRWDADIAVIKLENDVKLSENIRPVCMWTAKLKKSKTNDGGLVVGW